MRATWPSKRERRQRRSHEDSNRNDADQGLTVPLAVAFALVLGLAWFLGSAGQVHACKCVQPGSPSEEMEKFAAVFAGRVVSIEHSFDPNSTTRGPGDRTTVGLEVSTVWKGAVHEDMYVTTPPTGGSCGFAFEEGREYILYAHDSAADDDVYTVSICSRTALLSQAQADLEAFGDGDAPQSGTAGPQPEQTRDAVGNSALIAMLGAVAAIILLGAVAAVVWVRRQ